MEKNFSHHCKLVVMISCRKINKLAKEKMVEQIIAKVEIKKYANYNNTNQ